MHPVSEVEIAEITKIAENAHRYLQIAFAEELCLYCQANKINFPELREALNVEPREGIGRHCLGIIKVHKKQNIGGGYGNR